MKASELGSNGVRSQYATALEQRSITGPDKSDATPYVELLRRPAPRYQRC
jgi:hypothetical protein